MANQANLEATLAAIEANPDHWDQEQWHCNTRHCFAGFAEMLRIKRELVQPVKADECPMGLIDREATREWLGLTENQWAYITDWDNELADLRRMVTKGVPEYIEDDDDVDDEDEDDYLDDEYDDDQRRARTGNREPSRTSCRLPERCLDSGKRPPSWSLAAAGIESEVVDRPDRRVAQRCEREATETAGEQRHKSPRRRNHSSLGRMLG